MRRLPVRSPRDGVTEQIRTATAAYRQEEDRIAAFIDECCETGETFAVTVSDLFAAYQRWAFAGGEESVDKRTFGGLLRSAGYAEPRKSNNKRLWKGLRLTSSTPLLAAVAGRR